MKLECPLYRRSLLPWRFVNIVRVEHGAHRTILPHMPSTTHRVLTTDARDAFRMLLDAGVPMAPSG